MRHGPRRHITNLLNRKSSVQHTKMQCNYTKINMKTREAKSSLARPWYSSAAGSVTQKAYKNSLLRCHWKTLVSYMSHHSVRTSTHNISKICIDLYTFQNTTLLDIISSFNISLYYNLISMHSHLVYVF